jgi:hypothetical protein
MFWTLPDDRDFSRNTVSFLQGSRENRAAIARKYSCCISLKNAVSYGTMSNDNNNNKKEMS